MQAYCHLDVEETTRPLSTCQLVCRYLFGCCMLEISACCAAFGLSADQLYSSVL